MSHSQISPAIYYWGTPAVLISTQNEDGSSNIGPMSSAFWLGNRCILGLEFDSQTTINLLRTGECVLNLPSDDMIPTVNALARTTGTYPMPDFKQANGYRYVKDKFAEAPLTAQASEIVNVPRIEQCPVQMEARLVQRMTTKGGFLEIIEVELLRTYVIDKIRMKGHKHRVDPDFWRPMIMSFQQLYGLREGGRTQESVLAGIQEENYRALAPLPGGSEDNLPQEKQIE
ncbi:hypothetical protein LTR97_009513 [Elasticomyces elasticus]|uniref:Flavin reductase like domain-containing protein n=1 Tax=Elasticomyces elasticus TaxID=574655 RepID=A0AAN7VWV1_9PEZI|nr:hypothetical protein LTR97_009513 [Elasticomyces elasticus]